MAAGQPPLPAPPTELSRFSNGSSGEEQGTAR
jgi:hypothetical protein